MLVRISYYSKHIYRIVINFANALTNNNPLVPDYIRHESRGIATALASLSGSLGALISVKFLFGELKEWDYAWSSCTVGSINLVVALFMLYGVKDISKTK